MIRPVLIGEVNPYGGPGANALIPEPPGCTAHRLCHRILQLTEEAYYEQFERVNLCRGTWDAPAAAQAVARLLVGEFPPWFREILTPPPLVLLGVRVKAAFGFPAGPRWGRMDAVYPGSLAARCYAIPHPSGSNRLYRDPKDPGAERRAREVVQAARGGQPVPLEAAGALLF